MKDAKGHGSNPRGAHAEGTEQIGQVALTPSLSAMKMKMTGSATVPTSQSFPEGSWQRRDMEMLEASNARLTGGNVDKMNRATARGIWRNRGDAKLISRWHEGILTRLDYSALGRDKESARNEMKDAKGHGSNPRGVTSAHATGVDAVGKTPLALPAPAQDRGPTAYHATLAAFDKFSDPNESNQFEMMDRRLGTHFAADPEVSNSFVVKKDQGTWRTPPADFSPEGARIMRVSLPPKSQFIRVDQPQYDWAKQQGRPRTPGNIVSDQDAIDKMIARVAFQKDPELLARNISSSRNIPPDKSRQIAQGMVAGKKMNVHEGEGREMDLDDYIRNFGGHVHNPADQKRMVNLARQEWRSQGYKGIRYRDTSPMEMEHAKDNHAYILFDGNDAKPRYGK